MSIGKRKNSSEILPRLKVDGRTGGLYREDRVHTKGQGWDTEQTNIPHDKFRAIMDLVNFERGYFSFPRGAAPDMRLYPLGRDIGDAPSDKHKEGIRVVMKLDASLGSTVREFVSTAVGVYYSFDALHDEYLAGLADHPGQLPIVECVGVQEEKTSAGTSAAPIWKIVGWAPRPPELPASGIPPYKPTKKASDDAEEFGTVKEYKRPRPKDGMDDEIPF
jgi:hypothetical protein